jgi:hypothetical protein
MEAADPQGTAPVDQLRINDQPIGAKLNGTTTYFYRVVIPKHVEVFQAPQKRAVDAPSASLKEGRP